MKNRVWLAAAFIFVVGAGAHHQIGAQLARTQTVSVGTSLDHAAIVTSDSIDQMLCCGGDPKPKPKPKPKPDKRY